MGRVLPAVRACASSITALGFAFTISATAAAQVSPTRPEITRAVTRAEAVASALATSTRHTFARADVASASAQLSVARQYENPALTTAYSASAPQVHVTLDVPFDWPSVR